MTTFNWDDFNWDNYETILFDLDGVLTPTAEVHMRAWDRMFNEFLSTQVQEVLADNASDETAAFAEVGPKGPVGPAADTSPYTDADYYAYVDGKPRYEGVWAFLEARSIHMPFGDPNDAPDDLTVCGLGNRKNTLFNEVLAEEGIAAYPGSVALLDALAQRDIAMAVVSSSKNAPEVLTTSGLAERFKVVVDGAVANKEGLPGKPQPDTYTHAAHALNSTAERSIVVEDAISGIKAGRGGDFGLVIGVDRGAGRQALLDAGADVVVEDLAELLEG